MSAHWVFGYGSLIWRPDMVYREQRRARIHGWVRRFWQGSHDHRGLPHAPGRVVTLVPDEDSFCEGMAYLIERDGAEETFAKLDHREKNGYQRHAVHLEFYCGAGADGVVYIAEQNNHAFLGSASMEAIAAQVLQSAGPSGTNLDYVFELAAALRSLEIKDPHVFELERMLKLAGESGEI